MTRFAVIRVPTSGPPALIAEPNDFATEADAEARIAAIEGKQIMPHHTYLDILGYDGGLQDALLRKGILF